MHVHVVDAPSGALNAPSTTQGAYCWVHTYHHASLSELVELTRREGVAIAGAMMEGSITVHELPSDRPIMLLFGNEGVGLSEEARAACEFRFRIPMVGMSESMNLSVSAALALYTITRARREHLRAPAATCRAAACCTSGLAIMRAAWTAACSTGSSARH